MRGSRLTRVRVFIRGHVQGVGFRESTRAEAERFGVGGWVRNLEDGRVEGLFTGDPAAVEALVAWCQHGPPQAGVLGVDVVHEKGPDERGFGVVR